MGRLANRVAVVTGGGRGIGRATCERFAEEGALVVVADRDAAIGNDTAEAIRRAGGQARFIPVDVADEPSVQRLADEVGKAFGRVDVLVNNAAIFVLRGIEATPEEWRQILEVNVMGPALVSKHLVPWMQKAGGGAIVNLGSISSFIAQPSFVTYNATKGAIAQITRCMAMDLAPLGIRVNAVCPGTVWTQIVERRAAERGLDRAAAESHPDFGGANLLGRIADPREIASAILFLASDDASYVTGENLMVDAGYTAK